MLSPAMARLSDTRQQLFLFTLTLISRYRGDGLDAASDADAASAAAALAGTYETASKGLIYEQRPDSIPAQRMADGIRAMFERLGHGRPTAFAADAAAVLRQVEDCVTAARRAAPGDPRAFLALAERMSARLGEPGPDEQQDGSGQPPDGAGVSPIILP